jgi:chromosome segregation ATPase
MSNEEIERAIDFLLRSQANSEARIEQTNEQLNRLAGTVDQLAGKVVELAEGFDRVNFQLGSYADTQAEFMRMMTMYMESEAQDKKSAAARQARLEEAQARAEESEKQIHASLAASQKRAEESQARVNEILSASQERAEESQARINESLRASIGDLAAKQSKTEEALARLADAQAQSERSLDRLTRIVEEERGR